ncbi:DNA repair nuclease APEX1-like isoform X2 [Haliotis asinina]|uniref:DNA repair nuclease APEX1-like isoform X2 n=1 Tax=Haliotis asinina TaxID=109174 RepID=UPI003531E790
MPPKSKKKAAKEVVDADAAAAEEPPAKKTKKGKKDEADEGEEATPKKGKGKKKDEENGDGDNKKVVIPTLTLDEQDFSSSAKTKDGLDWNLKISSWNINGIRAWLGKEGTAYISKEAPDIFCVQETKCSLEKMPDTVNVDGYHAYWSSGDAEGYAGTGMYCKKKPIEVMYGIGVGKHDKEGRVITAEFEKFYMVTAYIPNSGRGLTRLNYRTKEWDVAFQDYMKKLDAKKPVILCGDLNVAHLDIDLKNPKTNKKTAGFTPQEREGFTNLLNEGFVDSFRLLYPEQEGAYTFWAYFMNNRAKDVGWRLDYFVISERLKDTLCDSIIRKFVQGSDHCPIVLLLNL